MVRAARSPGRDVPVYTGPTSEDPLVRQRLADYPEWLDGLTFVSFRVTREVGPEPFATHRAAYERELGVHQVGVRAGGRPVLAPPDWSAYLFDAVKLVAAAVQAGGAVAAQAGVSPDGRFPGRLRDLRSAPVEDDLLSTGLPTVAQ